jgi:hypothetical protein
LTLITSPCNRLKSFRRQFQIQTARSLRLLLEAVQYIHPFGSRREIDHSENSGRVSRANFLNPRADTCHRLPILRIEAALNPIQFKAQSVLRGFGKLSDVVPAAAHPDYRLHPNTMPYLAYVCNMWHNLNPRIRIGWQLSKMVQASSPRTARPKHAAVKVNPVLDPVTI